MAVALIAIAGITAAAWRGRYSLTIALLHLALAALDWLSLEMLPRLKRSFGPIYPPLIALTLLRAVVTILIGLAGSRSMGAMVVAVVVQAGMLAVTLYGLWIEPFRIGVTEERLQTPKLDPALPPVRVLHLGDLHAERMTPREERLQALVEELAPDVIVFSGDFVNLSYANDPETGQTIREIVSRWEAPYGVFVVSGSPLVESQEHVAQFVDGTGVRWLRDEVAEIDVRGQRLSLLGVTCAHNIEDDTARTRKLVEQTPDSRFRLLLLHTPDIVPQASEMGIDLYLSGHTHGGQWRLPLYGALITSSAYGKQFEMGRYTVGGTTLYVTRGIGMEGASAPRARLLCPPEIILWTLSGE